MLKDILSKAGYDPIVEAENGLVAVEKFKEEKINTYQIDIKDIKVFEKPTFPSLELANYLVDKEYSEEYAEGYIISQDPEKNKKIKALGRNPRAVLWSC